MKTFSLMEPKIKAFSYSAEIRSFTSYITIGGTRITGKLLANTFATIKDYINIPIDKTKGKGSGYIHFTDAPKSDSRYKSIKLTDYQKKTLNQIKEDYIKVQNDKIRAETKERIRQINTGPFYIVKVDHPMGGGYLLLGKPRLDTIFKNFKKGWNIGSVIRDPGMGASRKVIAGPYKSMEEAKEKNPNINIRMSR